MAFLSSSEVLDIVDAVYSAVFKAFKTPTQPEPQLVANLVWQLPKHINQIGFSGATKISSGGVFVHSQPFVSCPDFPDNLKKSVEIGDLLLIRTLVQQNTVVEKRALLLQAKKVKSIPTQPDNPNQWHLYEQWPKFTYAHKSGGLTGQKRHIKEPDMYDAAKYLLIGADPAACYWHPICCVDWPIHLPGHWPHLCCQHTAQPTKPVISRYRCFAGELLEFLTGNAGKVFVDPPTDADGWDQVIHDLITETANAKKSIYAGRAADLSTSAMRGNGVLFCSLAGQSNFSLFGAGDDGAASNFDEPPNVPAEWNGDDNGGGVSIIEFVVEQGKG